MNKLDKNLGVVVYTMQREKEAIKGHLRSSNFTLVQDDRQLQLHSRRKEIWNTILEQAQQMFDGIDMPKELSECFPTTAMPWWGSHADCAWSLGSIPGIGPTWSLGSIPGIGPSHALVGLPC